MNQAGKTGRRTPLTLNTKSKKIAAHIDLTVGNDKILPITKSELLKRKEIEAPECGEQDKIKIESRTEDNLMVKPNKNESHNQDNQETAPVTASVTKTNDIDDPNVKIKIVVNDENNVVNNDYESPQKKNSSQLTEITQNCELINSDNTKFKFEYSSDMATLLSAESEISSVNVFGNSVTLEKDFKGFTSDGDEMDSLIGMVDLQNVVSLPLSHRISGRIFKMKDSPTPNKARVSPLRQTVNLNELGFTGNLSPLTEQSNEDILQSSRSNLSYGSTLRKISGRKATRSVPDNLLRNILKEQRSVVEDSMSSLNVTVGSDISDDISFRTPIAKVLGRKRAVNSNDFIPENPKRAKFANYLSDIITSPVTMLRNKMQSTKIQSSTPNKIEIELMETGSVDGSISDIDNLLTDEVITIQSDNNEKFITTKTESDIHPDNIKLVSTIEKAKEAKENKLKRSICNLM